MRKFKFLDPEVIMGVLVALIILAVGVFAFFVTIQTIDETLTDTKEEENKAVEETLNNISEIGNDMSNIIGVVLIIGAIMAIVGVVYSFVGRDYSSSRSNASNITDYDDYPRFSTSGSHERQLAQRIVEAKEREKQRKIEAKKKAEVERKKKAEIKEKQAYNKGRPSRTSKAARMLDEQEGTRKRRKST